MRFLTVLSALIMAAAGAFCFAFYMNGYAGVAFVLGAALLLYGFFHMITYAIGFAKSRLPETVFVEGAVSLALGFLIVGDYVAEGSISLYFGIWFFTTGIIRFTEALNVSKINPRNWFAVLPLSLINIMLGFVMTVPSLLADFDDVYLIAITYILQSFSVAIYALYMLKRNDNKKFQEAKDRAEAKRRLAEEKRRERDRIRQLTEAEREAEIEAARKKQVKEAEEKAEARRLKKENRKPVSERTMSFTPEETAQIAAEAAAAKAFEIFEEEKEVVVETVETVETDAQIKPVFVKPTNIPTIEKEEVVEVQKDDLNLAQKRGLVNLEEFESKIPEVEFSTPELPEVELKTETAPVENREDIIQQIQGIEIHEEEPVKDELEELPGFAPLSLEELFADEQYAIKPLSDAKSTETDLKLTQTFTFDWLDTKLK